MALLTCTTLDHDCMCRMALHYIDVVAQNTNSVCGVCVRRKHITVTQLIPTVTAQFPHIVEVAVARGWA